MRTARFLEFRQVVGHGAPFAVRRMVADPKPMQSGVRRGEKPARCPRCPEGSQPVRVAPRDAGGHVVKTTTR